MLVQRHGVAKPGQVAHVDQKGGRLKRIAKADGQLLAKQILVTNVGCQSLPGHIERGRRGRAAAKVAQGNVHHLGEPTKQGRHKLTKRHQMRLVVAVGAPRMQAHGTVVVLPRLQQRQPDQSGLCAR